MNGTANFTRKNVDTDKEEWGMTYTIKKAPSMKKLEEIKEEIDKVIVKAGGQTTLDETEEG